MSAPTEEELEGAKMIIALQKMANITETQETALRGWRKLSPSEKRTTRLAYDTITRVVPQ